MGIEPAAFFRAWDTAKRCRERLSGSGSPDKERRTWVEGKMSTGLVNQKRWHIDIIHIG
jgi:hypothetical protein